MFKEVLVKVRGNQPLDQDLSIRLATLERTLFTGFKKQFLVTPQESNKLSSLRKSQRNLASKNKKKEEEIEKATSLEHENKMLRNENDFLKKQIEELTRSLERMSYASGSPTKKTKLIS